MEKLKEKLISVNEMKSRLRRGQDLEARIQQVQSQGYNKKTEIPNKFQVSQHSSMVVSIISKWTSVQALVRPGGDRALGLHSSTH